MSFLCIVLCVQNAHNAAEIITRWGYAREWQSNEMTQTHIRGHSLRIFCLTLDNSFSRTFLYSINTLGRASTLAMPENQHQHNFDVVSFSYSCSNKSQINIQNSKTFCERIHLMFYTIYLSIFQRNWFLLYSKFVYKHLALVEMMMMMMMKCTL